MEKAQSTDEEAVPSQKMSPTTRAETVDEKPAVISGETIGQLIQMQNEYMELKGLQERERASSQILIEALKDSLLELDTTVPLSKESLSPAFPNVRESWLSPDSVVTVIDSSGTKTSIPLEDLPSNAIALALQDCAVKLNELMSQKLDREARNVDLLEKAVWEFKNAGKPSDQAAPASVTPQVQIRKVEPRKVEEKKDPPASDSKLNKSGKGDGGRFEYSAEFKKQPKETWEAP